MRGRGTPTVDQSNLIYHRDLQNHNSNDADPASKVRTDPRPVPGEKTGVFIVAGQSNTVNDHTSGYAIANPAKLDNIDMTNGACYRASEPLLGCQTVPSPATQGNMFLGVADKLVTAGTFQRVILLPVGIGATTVAEWEGDFYRNIIAAHGRIKIAGLTLSGILWQQGESDTATSTADYIARFNSMKGKVQAAGATAPWFVAKSTWLLGTPNPTIRAALAGVVNGTDVFAGPDTDALDNTYRYDTTHFNAAGRDVGAAGWQAMLSPRF